MFEELLRACSGVYVALYPRYYLRPVTLRVAGVSKYGSPVKRRCPLQPYIRADLVCSKPGRR